MLDAAWEALEAAARPFGYAARLFTSGVHNGGLEHVQAFPTAQEWRIIGGLFPKESVGSLQAHELRAALEQTHEQEMK